MQYSEIIDLKRECEPRHVVACGLRIIADIMHHVTILEGIRGCPPVCHVLPVQQVVYEQL